MRDYTRTVLILMAEDDPDDQLLTKEALDKASLQNEVHFVDDGVELLDYLYQRGEYKVNRNAKRPGIILLDLNLPRMDGREALAVIKSDEDLRRIPIIVLTTSRSEEDILRSYNLGVSGYIPKPATLEGLTYVMRTLTRYWFETVELPPM